MIRWINPAEIFGKQCSDEPKFLLLGTLHPWSSLLLVFIIGFLPLLLLPAPHLLFYVDIMQGGLLTLVQLHVRQLAPWFRWKDLLHGSALGRGEHTRLGKLDIEFNKQTTLHERTAMLRHTLIINGLVLTYSNKIRLCLVQKVFQKVLQ